MSLCPGDQHVEAEPAHSEEGLGVIDGQELSEVSEGAPKTSAVRPKNLVDEEHSTLNLQNIQ